MLLDPTTFAVFTDELAKLAASTRTGRAVDKVVSKVKGRDLAAAAAGAGTLEGARRVWSDMRTGRQMRKQRRY